MNQPVFRPYSPNCANTSVNTAAPMVTTLVASPQTKPTFNPISPQKIKAIGASSQRVVDLMATFESPTGILMYGQDVMDTISKKADKLLDEVKDANVDFVQTQMSQLLVMAKSFHLHQEHESEGFSLHGLLNKVKGQFIDVKEQMLGEFNNVCTQMDRIISEVDGANVLILEKVKGLQEQYKSNLVDYQNLEQLIKDAEEVLAIKTREYEALAVEAQNDPMKAENASKLSKSLDRLEKKIANFRAFQMMCLQDAPDFAMMEDNAITLI